MTYQLFVVHKLEEENLSLQLLTGSLFLFRRSLTCTIGLTNDLIDGGQPRAKNGF